MGGQTKSEWGGQMDRNMQYGPDHYANLLHLAKYAPNVNHYYDDLPEEHAAPYLRSVHCTSCPPIPEAAVLCTDCITPDNYYLFVEEVNLNNLAEGNCNFIDQSSQYFKFIPNSINGTGTCNQGGLVVYQGMDESGYAVEKSVYIPPNSALEHLFGKLPKWYPLQPGYRLDCSQSGWCFFEAEDILGVPSPDGQPIVAQWADLGTCVIEHDGGGGTTPVDEDCECETAGFYCDNNGDCVPIAPEDCDCDPGYEECVNGVCIPIEPAGCQNGFITSYLRCGYNNPCSFTFNSDGNDILRIQYVTFAKQDRLIVRVNGIERLNECYPATGAYGWQNRNITITEDSEITILMQSDCETEVDAFNWLAFCGSNFQDGDEQGLVAGGDDGLSFQDMLLYPNPFNSDINMVFNNHHEPFSGTIRLFNAQGVEVSSRVYDFMEGENNLTLDNIAHLHEGLYTVLVFGDAGLVSSKNVIKL